MEKSINVNIVQRRDATYILNSSFLTITITSLAFLVALAWNDVAQISFERRKCEKDEIYPAVKYALFITLAAILAVFLFMYYINGTKW